MGKRSSFERSVDAEGWTVVGTPIHVILDLDEAENLLGKVVKVNGQVTYT